MCVRVEGTVIYILVDKSRFQCKQLLLDICIKEIILYYYVVFHHCNTKSE